MSNITKKEENFFTKDYRVFLDDIKERIANARIKATLAVNRELVLLYWQIGREILNRQNEQGWGAKVIERLSKDLKNEFPEMKGFSRTNLLYMRSFAENYPDEQFVQEVLGQITWYHNIALLDKLKDRAEREWYARQTIENGWSRNILALQIQSNLYARQGKAITNFQKTLPAPQSELAQNLLKDPYNFDFLGLGKDALERDVENSLLTNLQKFLVELGTGFAFVGKQYHLEIGGQDFYLDLLFYHLKLRCFVVIDLKSKEFKPEFAGKMNFYLAAVDDLLSHETDSSAIGLILCRDKNKLIVEYSLRQQKSPIGVSDYQITEHLPQNLQGSLPTVEEIEAKLADEF